MFLNLLRQVQEEALSREVAKRKLPNEVRDKKIAFKRLTLNDHKLHPTN